MYSYHYVRGQDSLTTIHPQALVDPTAELADDVEVGPFAIIGPEVTIGAGTVVGPHAILKGPTTIGAGNRIFQFASVGEDCQDKKYKGERTESLSSVTIMSFVKVRPCIVEPLKIGELPRSVRITY